jgi:hypothetical protein
MTLLRRAVRRAFPFLSRRPQPFLVAPHQRNTLELLPPESTDIAATGAGDPVVVSFGTRDGVYDAYLGRLEESCRSVGQPVLTETFPAMPAENALALKATFIKFKLLTQGRPVIWIDADAVLTAPIVLPPGAWDVGSVKNNLDNPKNPVAALCIAFRPTVAALRFLEHWEAFCASHWLKPGEDHRRLNYTRFVLDGHFAEADISAAVRGRLVRDAGRAKEHAF